MMNTDTIFTNVIYISVISTSIIFCLTAGYAISLLRRRQGEVKLQDEQKQEVSDTATVEELLPLDDNNVETNSLAGSPSPSEITSEDNYLSDSNTELKNTDSYTDTSSTHYSDVGVNPNINYTFVRPEPLSDTLLHGMYGMSRTFEDHENEDIAQNAQEGLRVINILDTLKERDDFYGLYIRTILPVDDHRY